MREIVYVKKVDHEREMLKKENQRIPFLISRSLFLYRSLLNRITKKKVEGSNLWILPIKKTYSERKIRCMIRKLSMSPENIYILSNDLESKPIYKMMEEYAIQYLNGTQIKKFLLIPILEYIVQIQNKELKEIELTLLINDPSEVNLYLLEKLAKIVKNVKIVSSQMYKFKKIEELR